MGRNLTGSDCKKGVASCSDVQDTRRNTGRARYSEKSSDIADDADGDSERKRFGGVAEK